jgi:hypothetical protein
MLVNCAVRRVPEALANLAQRGRHTVFRHEALDEFEDLFLALGEESGHRQSSYSANKA